MAATASSAWGYSVPLEETDGNARPLPHHRRGSQERAPKHVGRRPSARDLQSDTESTNVRRASVRASNLATASRKRSRNTLRDKLTRVDNDERVDDSAWIHRDKLAQIEIKEMEEAGFHVRPSRRSMSADPEARSRSVSRTGQRRRMSHDNKDEDEDEDAYPGYEELEKQRMSTVPSQNGEDQNFDPQIDTEFRTPEELAAEHHEPQKLVRPSTSRIPISVGVLPGPPATLGRDRSGSGAWSKEWDDLAQTRRGRSGSMSSQVLLDDTNAVQTTPPGSSNMNSSAGENSPPKSRVPRKVTPAGRKGSMADSQTAARPPSSHQNRQLRAGSGAQTNGTALGHKSRPSTSHGPEGEAPWIAGMYKPDPRLPPEQQMLPTHAKRMAQQQWEKQGKTGTAYDREFRLLNDDELQPHRPPTLTLDKTRLDLDHTMTNGSIASSPGLQVPGSPAKTSPATSTGANGGSGWPLTPRSLGPAGSDTRSDTASARPGTSKGYKITPTIPDTPTIERPAASLGLQTIPTQRMPDLDEKQEAQPKKGCCCVVM